MPLPIAPLATGSATVNGTEVPIRALSRAEVRKLRQYSGRSADAEPFIVSCGTGESIDDAEAWLSSVGVKDGGDLVDAILVLSGLVDPEADPEDPPVGSTGAGPDAPPSNEP